MAKSSLPLLSASAHGTLADLLTFYIIKPGQKVRWQNKPSPPNTLARCGRRILMAFAVKAWRALSLVQKETYNVFADGRPLSGYNWFVSEYLRLNVMPYCLSHYGRRTYGIFLYGKNVFA